MNKVFTQSKRFLNLIRGFFPSALPVGMTEFKVWSDTIVSTYGLPDNDSVRFTLATMCMHLKPTSAFKSNWYFALSVWKGMSNQVVYQVMQDLKAKQAAEQQKQAEVTALKVASSDDSKSVSQLRPL